MSPIGAADLDPVFLRELRALAEEVSRIGAHIAHDAVRSDLAVQFKPDNSEVTSADLAAEHAILDLLRQRRPDDFVVAEEMVSAGESGAAAMRPISPSGARARREAPASGVCWAIDPIDGTRNFVRGIRYYGCSIGALIGGVPVAGAICDPAGMVVYSASRGEGLLVDGSRANADTAARDQASRGRRLLVATPSTRDEHTWPIVEACFRMHVTRCLGSTALHLVYVSLGMLDVALLGTCKLWDIAAGHALIAAAGGVMTDVRGQPLFPIDAGRYAGEEMPAIAYSTPTVQRRFCESILP